MNQEKAIRWLKAAFMVGAITDALALIPMLFNNVARIFWGIETFTDTYVFAMRLAAVFMLAWTILLFWAWKKPSERKFIALLTILILVWFFSLEVWAVSNRVLRFQKIIPSMILQIMWIALFSYSYLYSLMRIKSSKT